MTMPSPDDIELAKKLVAAYFSHIKGAKSIDRVLKRDLGPQFIPRAEWIELARQAKVIHRNS